MDRHTLLQYKEFGADTENSIKDHFLDEPYKQKEAVVFYLRNTGEIVCVACGRGTDAITGDPIPGGSKRIINDGEYSWNSDLVYYVEKYNMRLPREFEDKAVRWYKEQKK